MIDSLYTVAVIAHWWICPTNPIGEWVRRRYTEPQPTQQHNKKTWTVEVDRTALTPVHFYCPRFFFSVLQPNFPNMNVNQQAQLAILLQHSILSRKGGMHQAPGVCLPSFQNNRSVALLKTTVSGNRLQCVEITNNKTKLQNNIWPTQPRMRNEKRT